MPTFPIRCLGLSAIGFAWMVGALMPSACAEGTWKSRVLQDWIRAEHLAVRTPTNGPIATTDDAAGGCDGVVDGSWGFHTAESDQPWWQVDLGTPQTLNRVVIWNRPEASERARRLQVKLSDDGRTWRTAYTHDGTVFVGHPDRKPLRVPLDGAEARYVRIQLPGKSFLHLEEVEVYGTSEPSRNLALQRPADQSGTSQWSRSHQPPRGPDWAEATTAVRAAVRDLETSRGAAAGHDWVPDGPADAPADFLTARARLRELLLREPLLDFDTLLFTKRVHGSFNHMSDQYYGWWSKPGGGLFLLRNFTRGQPREECISGSLGEGGSFLRPTLSYDGRKVLFAWCRHYPHLAAETNKLDKANVPEDAFYHLFEMNLDGTGLRQLTRGKYDDFDGRYLPDGRIVFLSTRRGQALQVSRATAARTLIQPDLPDSYVRCGGGPERPVAVYTLHTMAADGSDVVAISPFEMFEWTPEIGHDGSILYSRWDYIDRDNMPYMGLWAINPDGSNARLVFKNYTAAPHCVFEAKPIPGSSKLIFTASGHHAQTMGSLVLLDPQAGPEGNGPMTRLTPEVPFPEIEGWPNTYYASPWPLSERVHLVAWGDEGARVPGPAGWDRWHAVQRPSDATAIYLYDAQLRRRELLWADPGIACVEPIPVRARPRPQAFASQLIPEGPQEGRFLVSDVTRGLSHARRGEVKSLRIVAVPAKTHPTMNFPRLGITADDPGKCVLGTVPVERDGSAYFRVPSGMILFFQALDEGGRALQTMRSVTHVQPGQTLSCIGCHEHRQQAPPAQAPLAATRAPSRIRPGPDGSWPLRFDQLVQPVLERRCVSCHRPGAADPAGARFDLTADRAYDTLIGYGKPSLKEQVWTAYRRGTSLENEGIAQRSALLTLLDAPAGHRDVRLDADDRERLLTWMDTYAQRLGHFDEQQERELLDLRRQSAALMEPRSASQAQHKAAGRATASASAP